MVNKHTLVKKIVAQLAGELELYAKSARAAHEEATHEQSKAENKYDTRGLEASYLAHGQAQQAAETELARLQFDAMEVRDFRPGAPIGLGALVELESGLEGEGERLFYFIGPRAGGTEIVHEQTTVLVITPHSPLGRQLQGKREGERLKMEMGKTRSDFRVVAVL